MTADQYLWTILARETAGWGAIFSVVSHRPLRELRSLSLEQHDPNSEFGDFEPGVRVFVRHSTNCLFSEDGITGISARRSAWRCIALR